MAGTGDDRGRRDRLDALRQIVREELARSAPAVGRIESMTVDEFAYVVRLHRETVLLKIRRRAIPRELVSKKAKGFRIRPPALDLFGVSPEEGVARLAAYRATARSPKRTATPVAHSGAMLAA